MNFKYNSFIPTFWYSSNNFGDSVTHYLVRKISGKMPVLVDREDEDQKIMVTGSILNNNVVNAIVWGCGIANENDFIPDHDIRAVRGKMLWEKLKILKENPPENINYSFDVNKIAVGDPCLLLPQYYNPEIKKKYIVGIIPHYADAKDFWLKIAKTTSYLDNLGILIIDINSQIEQFIDLVLSCETILSSSLHGIICADAYGIPSSYIKISNKVLGDDFKFKDWFSNYFDRDFNYYDFTKLEKIEINDILEISQHKKSQIVWKNNLCISLEFLKETCPL